MSKHPESRIRTAIEKRYEDAIRDAFRKRQGLGNKWITKREATQLGHYSGPGVIREVILNVDPLKALGFDTSSAVAAAFLKKFSAQKFSQLTIHVGDLSESSVESFTGLVEMSNWPVEGLHKGDYVLVSISAVKIPPAQWTWMIKVSVNPV